MLTDIVSDVQSFRQHGTAQNSHRAKSVQSTNYKLYKTILTRLWQFQLQSRVIVFEFVEIWGHTKLQGEYMQKGHCGSGELRSQRTKNIELNEIF